MASKYEKMNLLKNLPFYSEESKSVKKTAKNFVILNYYLNYRSFFKETKE